MVRGNCMIYSTVELDGDISVSPNSSGYQNDRDSENWKDNSSIRYNRHNFLWRSLAVDHLPCYNYPQN